MNLWQWLALFITSYRSIILYLTVVKIYPKGGGYVDPFSPQGRNISRLYPACYSTKAYIGGIYFLIIFIITQLQCVVIL